MLTAGALTVTVLVLVIYAAVAGDEPEEEKAPNPGEDSMDGQALRNLPEKYSLSRPEGGPVSTSHLGGHP